MIRFIEAQKKDYTTALAELRAGRKKTHWIWYIFPQIAGLGHSATSKYYAIKNLQEAAEYLEHPMLGQRLIECCEVMLALNENNATNILGSPDDLKLKSSMTLFSLVKDTNPVFQDVLNKFFDGEKDERTIVLHFQTEM